MRTALLSAALIAACTVPRTAMAQAAPAATASAPATATAPATAPPPASSPASPDCTVLPQPGSPCSISGGRATAIRTARIGVEIVLGTLLGAGLGALGAYAGLNADLASGNQEGSVGMALGTTFGVALGVGPGVWLGGTAMRGDGSFGWTMLASAAGSGASAALLAVDASPGMLVIAATIPVSMSVVAFELSSHVKRPAKAAPTRGSITPSVGPSFVGVVGTF